MDGVKFQIIILFKTKDYSKPKRLETVYGSGKKTSNLKIQKQSEEDIIKLIRDLFNLKKENETIKYRKKRDIRTLCEQENNDYKPIRVGNFWNNNYIEYKSSAGGNKNLLVKEYLEKNKPYLRDIIINFQIAIAVNFISSKDVDEERVMHSKSDNTEYMTYDNGNDVVDDLHFFQDTKLV